MQTDDLNARHVKSQTESSKNTFRWIFSIWGCKEDTLHSFGQIGTLSFSEAVISTGRTESHSFTRPRTVLCAERTWPLQLLMVFLVRHCSTQTCLPCSHSYLNFNKIVFHNPLFFFSSVSHSQNGLTCVCAPGYAWVCVSKTGVSVKQWRLFSWFAGG